MNNQAIVAMIKNHLSNKHAIFVDNYPSFPDLYTVMVMEKRGHRNVLFVIPDDSDVIRYSTTFHVGTNLPLFNYEFKDILLKFKLTKSPFESVELTNGNNGVMFRGKINKSELTESKLDGIVNSVIEPDIFMTYVINKVEYRA